MAWIKRNLFFVVGGILAIGLLGAAGYYNYKGWSHNTAAFNRLNEIYNTVAGILPARSRRPATTRSTTLRRPRTRKTSCGTGFVRREIIFKPIAPIPNTGTNAVSSEAFAAALRRTIDQMQHEAEAASVTLPPKYSFSFEAAGRAHLGEICARQPGIAGGAARRSENHCGSSFCGAGQFAGRNSARPRFRR